MELMKVNEIPTKEERLELVYTYFRSKEEFKELCEDSLIDYKDALKYVKKVLKTWENK